VTGQLPSAVRADSFAYAAALAVVATLLPILLFLKGLKRIGAARAGIIGTLEPLVTVILAAAVLGSVLGPFELIGGAMIVGASLLIHRAGLGRPEGPPVEAPRE
jgi:drug/metabolite transporter (DMT)-like permease